MEDKNQKKTTERPENFTFITTCNGTIVIIDNEGNVVIKSSEGVVAFDSSNPGGTPPPPPGHP